MSQHVMNILIVCDSPVLDTGFGRVGREVGMGLAKAGFGVSFLARYHRPGDRVLPFRIIPTAATEKDRYGEQSYDRAVEACRPDAVIAIGDEWMVRHIAVRPRRCPVIGYVAIDGFPLPTRWRPTLKAFDRLVVFGQFGQESVFHLDSTIQSTIIPHGVDSDTFRPRGPEGRASGRRLLGVRGDSFLVGVVGRNNPRKMVERAIKAFSRFVCPWVVQPDGSLVFGAIDGDVVAGPATGPAKTDAMLYLHMMMVEREGHDLHELVNRYNLWPYVRFPEGLQEGKGCSDDVLNMVYNALDVHAMPTGGEGFGLCLDGGSLVHLEGGAKRIADVVVGDRVLSQDGRFHEVLATTSREVDRVYEVCVTHSLTTLVTGEHPYLVARRCGLKHYRKSPVELEWINVRDIRPGNDLVFFPKPQYENKLPRPIRFSDHVDGLESDGEAVWLKMGFSPQKTDSPSYAEIQERYGVTKKVVECAVSCLRGDRVPVDGSKTYALAESLAVDADFVLPSPKKIKDEIVVDAQFLKWCGWYLAEGSTLGGSGVQIDLHIDEIEVAKDFLRYAEQAWGATGTVESRGNRSRVTICSGIISAFFGGQFGYGAANKTIPSWIEQAGCNLAPLVLAYFQGDGVLSRELGRIQATTTSPHLAVKMRDILSSVGILCSVRFVPKRLPGVMDQYSISVCKAHLDRFLRWVGLPSWETPCRSEHFVELPDGFLLPVRSVTPVDRRRRVFDIQVDGVHSFVANGILAHNTVLEGMAAGVPTMATEYSGHLDFCNGAVELLQPLDFITATSGVEHAIVDIEDFVLKLDRMYYEHDEFVRKWGTSLLRRGVTQEAIDGIQCGVSFREHLAGTSRERAVQYQWRDIIPKWIELLTSVAKPHEGAGTLSMEVV